MIRTDFETSPKDNFGFVLLSVRVAQWIEQGVSNPKVAGSSPAADILQSAHSPKGGEWVSFLLKRN